MQPPSPTPPKSFYHTLTLTLPSPTTTTSPSPLTHLAARLLGQPPNDDPFVALSPTPFYNHISLIRVSKSMPQCDFRVHPMTPSLRRLVFLTATRTFDCPYCTAHACAFGDILTGSLAQHSLRNRAAPLVPLDVHDTRLRGGEKALFHLAMAVGVRKDITRGVPLTRLMARVSHHFGVLVLDAVKPVLCVAGYLNTFMDLLGTELEYGLQQFTHHVFGRQGGTYDAGIHAATAVDDNVKAVGVLGNLARLLAVAPHMLKAGLMEREIFGGMPTSVDMLDSWIEQHLGFTPSWVRAIGGWELKRAVCFALKHNLVSEGLQKWEKPRKWARDERAALMYLYGSEVGGDELKEIAVCVARVGENELSKFARGQPGGKVVWSEAMLAAREVILRHLQEGQQVVGECVERMVELCTPETVMEFIGMVASFCYFYRAAALFGDARV